MVYIVDCLKSRFEALTGLGVLGKDDKVLVVHDNQEQCEDQILKYTGTPAEVKWVLLTEANACIGVSHALASYAAMVIARGESRVALITENEELQGALEVLCKLAPVMFGDMSFSFCIAPSLSAEMTITEVDLYCGEAQMTTYVCDSHPRFVMNKSTRVFEEVTSYQKIAECHSDLSTVCISVGENVYRGDALHTYLWDITSEENEFKRLRHLCECDTASNAGELLQVARLRCNRHSEGVHSSVASLNKPRDVQIDEVAEPLK